MKEMMEDLNISRTQFIKISVLTVLCIISMMIVIPILYPILYLWYWDSWEVDKKMSHILFRKI